SFNITVLIDESTLFLSDVVGIYINSPSITMETDFVEISSGTGLYAKCSVNSTIHLRSDSECIVDILTNSQRFEFHTPIDLTIHLDDEIEIMTKTPTVQASSGVFTELYSQLGLLLQTGSYGQTLEATDGLAFDIIISDTYTMMKNVEILGGWRLDPPKTQFNELLELQTDYIWFLLLLPAIPVVYYLLYNWDELKKKV
ncbi:MAG: hypothetical protein RTU30_13845, partial [Candidatus Thorarchaeota archaeon]